MNIRLLSGVALCCLLAVPAVAQEECGHPIAYEGKGAGIVIFDGAAHVAKGLTCATCHEGGAFSSALFEMKRGANPISMRRMELGRSCGSCHDGKQAFSTTDQLSCGKCHRK
ncbi:MAG: cytochrome c3 family protein [Nitrospiraceae bacterium]|nr:cytochrome c3 family protein [Nitrospiraceae bacterium]